MKSGMSWGPRHCPASRGRASRDIQGHPGSPEHLSGCRNALLARGSARGDLKLGTGPTNRAGALPRQESIPKTLVVALPEMLAGPQSKWDALQSPGHDDWGLSCEPQLGNPAGLRNALPGEHSLLAQVLKVEGRGQKAKPELQFEV